MKTEIKTFPQGAYLIAHSTHYRAGKEATPRSYSTAAAAKRVARMLLTKGVTKEGNVALLPHLNRKKQTEWHLLWKSEWENWDVVQDRL